MRTVQVVIQKAIAFVVLATGVYIIIRLLGYWPDAPEVAVPANRWAAYGLSILFILLGLIALLPPLRSRRGPSTITFPGEHGDVLIHLDSVQTNLNKVVSKRPEVRRSHVTLLPVEDKRRVRIEADVVLVKTPDAGARELAERLRKFLADAAASMLGIDEIAIVDLNVRGIVVDKSTVKAMASRDAAPVPAATKPEPTPAPEEVPATAAPAAEPEPSVAHEAATAETPWVSAEAPAAEPASAREPEPAEAPTTAWQPEPAEEPAAAWQSEPAEEPAAAWQSEPAEEPAAAWQPEPAEEPAAAWQPEPAEERLPELERVPEATSTFEPEPTPDPAVAEEPEDKPLPSWEELEEREGQEPGQYVADTHEPAPVEDETEDRKKEPRDTELFP
jgi:hypothetical protein